MHRQARKSDRSQIDNVRADDASPANGTVLREVVVNRAEARQVLRREAALTAKRITRKQTIAAAERLIEANRCLISYVMLVADVEIVVAVDAGADDSRRAH